MPAVLIRLTILIGLITTALLAVALVVGHSQPEPQQLTYTAFFSRHAYNVMDMYSLDVDRWLSARLTPGNGIYEDSMWSPDGKYMAYIQETSSEQRLYVMDATTHNVTGFGGHVYVSLIGWSPDSRYVAFQTVDYSAARVNLADVTNRDAFPINLPNIANGRLFWTVGSDHILYIIENGIQQDTLYGLEPACRPLDAPCGGYKIADLPFNYLAPARALYEWSPDGETLVLSGDADYQLDVYALKLTCPPQARCIAQVERLTNTVQDETAPTWSPTGDEIAYVADHTGVAIFNVASRAQRQIYSGDRAIRWIEFSPDGRWISVWSTDKRTDYIAYIELVDTLTGSVHALADGGLSHWFPAWRPVRVRE